MILEITWNKNLWVCMGRQLFTFLYRFDLPILKLAFQLFVKCRLFYWLLIYYTFSLTIQFKQMQEYSFLFESYPITTKYQYKNIILTQAWCTGLNRFKGLDSYLYLTKVQNMLSKNVYCVVNLQKKRLLLNSQTIYFISLVREFNSQEK